MRLANIVHFGKYYFPGAASAGHSVTVVCFSRKPLESEQLIDGVNVVRTSITKLIASQPLGFKYLLLSLKAAKKADIVHLHFPNMLGALGALMISKKTRLLVHWHSDVLNKGLLGKFLRPLESALLRRADSIVATSQVYADASEALARYRNKTTVVPIGVPDTKHEGEASSLPRAIEEKTRGKMIILAVGTRFR